MKTYELTYIISSKINSGQANALAKEVEGLVQEKEGVILKSNITSPQVLYHTMKNQSSGYFSVLEFQLEESKIKEIGENLKKNGDILRHFILVKKPVKEKKERRTRKPFAPQETSFAKSPSNNRKIVTENEIDKKLEEILSE